MKYTAILLSLLATSAFANIPIGKYKADEVKCKSGRALKLGGKFMVYTIFLEVAATEMTMTANANSGSWAPFKLNCTQVNRGKYVYTQENVYEGDLPNISVQCNNPAWTNILKRRLFGVEEYGQFNYTVNGNKLTIYNPNTITKYSCKDPGDYPIYYYTKQ